jgi:hypothetical protein
VCGSSYHSLKKGRREEENILEANKYILVMLRLWSLYRISKWSYLVGRQLELYLNLRGSPNGKSRFGSHHFQMLPGVTDTDKVTQRLCRVRKREGLELKP